MTLPNGTDALGIGDVHDLIGQLEGKLDGLADELDTAGDERDTLVWLVAEVSNALPMLMTTVKTLAMALGEVISQTGVKLNTDAMAPQRFVPKNRADRRRAQREAAG